MSFKKVYLFVILISIFGVSAGKVQADDIQSFDSVYQAGKNAGIITDSYEEFIKKCKEELFPAYLEFTSQDNSLSFAQYAAINNYNQTPKPDKNTEVIKLDNNGDRSAGSAAHIKAGDILVCYGGSSTGGILGHAAIAISSSNVLEMPGGSGKELKKNTREYPLSKFYDKHAKAKGDKYHILVYRVVNHPQYAKTAANYAWDKMYSKGRLDYSIFAPMYQINPSYCSKYVYLAYWYGNKHKGLKGNLAWVMPHTIQNCFIGGYKPKQIYNITYK